MMIGSVATLQEPLAGYEGRATRPGTSSALWRANRHKAGDSLNRGLPAFAFVAGDPASGDCHAASWNQSQSRSPFWEILLSAT